MAIIFCKAIIFGQHCTEIQEEIGVMLQNDAFLPEEFEVHPHKELFDKCRHLALVLLSNVLTLTHQEGCLSDAIQNQKWFTEFLIPSLLDEVKSFEISSNNARSVMHENSAIDDLKSANQFAVVNHNLLASETRPSLALLGHTI